MADMSGQGCFLSLVDQILRDIAFIGLIAVACNMLYIDVYYWNVAYALAFVAHQT